MRKVLQIIISIPLLLMLLSCSGDSLPKLDQGSTILAFGDSLTAGVGANKEESYPAQLSRMSRLEVINAGVSGETTRQGVTRFKTLVDDLYPDLIILLEGGNDILRNYPESETKANLASMRQQHEAAKGSKSQIRAQIESLTGRKFKNLPKLMRVAKLVSSDEEQLVQAAMAANPEIKAAQHRAVSQRHTSRAAYGQYLPQVNLYAQHDRAISAYSSSRQTTDWKVGVTLTMPLVDLSTVSSIAESRQRAQLASYQASDTKRNIALSVRSLYHQYTAGRKQIDLAQARVKYMRQIETAERERYNQGVGSLDQLLEQKRALAQSKIDEIGVKTDGYWTAYQLLIAANKFDLNKLGL